MRFSRPSSRWIHQADAWLDRRRLSLTLGLVALALLQLVIFVVDGAGTLAHRPVEAPRWLDLELEGGCAADW